MDAVAWGLRLRRFVFELKDFFMLMRFRLGKASYIETSVVQTTHSMTEIFDSGGRPKGPRMLSHYDLSTQPPQTGSVGWQRYLDNVILGHSLRTAELACEFCGHLFIVLLPNETQTAQFPASFRSHWFRFMHKEYQSTAHLNCVHCEQSAVPRVRFLNS